MSTSTQSRPKDGLNGHAAGAAEPEAPATRHFAEVAHSVHGRLRLKIPAASKDPSILDRLKTAITAIEGVDTVDVKASSASLVVYYDREHHPEIANLLRCLSQTGAAPLTLTPKVQEAVRPPANRVEDLTRSIEDEAGFLAEHSALARTVVSAVKRLDKDIKRSTNNNVDLKIMVPVALAAVTFMEIGAAAATPMWVTLAIFSLNHFVELHAHDADEE